MINMLHYHSVVGRTEKRSGDYHNARRSYSRTLFRPSALFFRWLTTNRRAVDGNSCRGVAVNAGGRKESVKPDRQPSSYVKRIRGQGYPFTSLPGRWEGSEAGEFPCSSTISKACMRSEEEWRSVVGYEDFYEVSSLGRVRVALHSSRVNQRGKNLKIQINRKGYPYATLSKRGRAKMIFVHRLVNIAFNGACPEGKHQTAHLDGTRTNNTPENLAWVTYRENKAHSIAHGTWNHGETCPLARLTEDTVRAIRKMYPIVLNYSEVGRRFGVGPQCIRAIISGHTWKHINQ